MLQRSVSTGTLGLEMPLQSQQQAYPPHPNPHSQPQQRNLSPFSSHSQSHAYSTYGYYGGGSSKNQSFDEEIGFRDDDAAKRVSQPQSPSPWHRMKWTDSMVRLLVWVVHSVGDDVDCAEMQHKGKKPATATAAAVSASGMQLKKGKWKSASRAMMEKGFYVSPQQCEDKFNDLNKRYKRVNELLGKGMACRVVENPALLDSMDHLPVKAKEEARKLLSSKHLFFREMCAYHNTCPSSTFAPLQPAEHSSVSPPTIKGRKGAGVGNYYHDEDVADDEDEEEDYNEDDSDEENEEDGMFATGGGGHRAKRKATISPAVSSPLSLTLSSPSGSSSAPMQLLSNEMMGLQGEQQQRQWLRMRAAELEEQRVVYQHRALQLERQRFKWLRFSSNKEREMERTKLRNERLRLENDRMLLLLQQKEICLLDSAGNVDASANAKANANANDNANAGLNTSNNFTADRHQN